MASTDMAVRTAPNTLTPRAPLTTNALTAALNAVPFRIPKCSLLESGRGVMPATCKACGAGRSTYDPELSTLRVSVGRLRLSVEGGRGMDAEKGDNSGEESSEDVSVDKGVDEVLDMAEEGSGKGTQALIAGFPMSVAAM
jgi:hypothetical protein